MILTPALFEQRVTQRKDWIAKAKQELANQGHTDPNLTTYCENLFSAYGSTHTPKKALARDIQS